MWLVLWWVVVLKQVCGLHGVIRWFKFILGVFHHKVVLFQCEWYNTGTNGWRRTIRTNAHCTSIDVTIQWYKNDPFILPSQARQVFYLQNTKLGEPWKIVQSIQHRGVFDVPEVQFSVKKILLLDLLGDQTKFNT